MAVMGIQAEAEETAVFDAGVAADEAVLGIV